MSTTHRSVRPLNLKRESDPRPLPCTVYMVDYEFAVLNAPFKSMWVRTTPTYVWRDVKDAGIEVERMKKQPELYRNVVLRPLMVN